ncbi:MAG: hypothetical protein U1E90_15065 [Burkholderiaceae bacterium]
MSNSPINSLQQLALGNLQQTSGTTGKRPTNFFEALSLAWASALDRQAQVVADKSQVVADGGDQISDITLLTAEASKLNFMSTSSNTSMSEASKSLETVARKG